MKHWTIGSVEALSYCVLADFVAQIQEQLDQRGITLTRFADLVGVDQERLDQVFNRPGKLDLPDLLRMVTVLDLKVSFVLHAHPKGAAAGPVNPGVFKACWKAKGEPCDFFALDEASKE